MTNLRLPVLFVVVLGLGLAGCGRKGGLEEDLPPPVIGADGKPKPQPDYKLHSPRPVTTNDRFILDRLL